MPQDYPDRSGPSPKSTYGTPVTVTHFYEFLSENFQFIPAFLDGAGLKSGQAFNRASRTVVSQFDVNGDLTMEHTSGEAATAVADSMGFWWKYALGSTLTTPVVVLGTAFKQVHTNGSQGRAVPHRAGRPPADLRCHRPAVHLHRRAMHRLGVLV